MLDYEFVAESRVDGYPIVKLSRNEKDSDKNNIVVELFLEYFRALKDKYGRPVDIQLVTSLEEKEEMFLVKIVLDTNIFKTELKKFEREIRKQKLDEIIEIGRK